MAGRCAFCDVVAGADHHLVYRDERVVAFLDHAPLVVGHTLVTPTAHVETLDDLPDALLEPLFRVVRDVSIAVQSTLGGDGSLVMSNTRISQSVPHVHIHVVPRRRSDGMFSPGRPLWMRRRYEPGEAEEVAAKLRAALHAA